MNYFALVMAVRPKNCTDLWVKFHAAFAFRGSCDVNDTIYTEYLEAARHDVDTMDRVRHLN